MADEDVQYASVVFKNHQRQQPPHADKKGEETVYDEVKVKVKNEQTELPLDKKAGNGCGRILLILCLGGIFLILVLGAIGGYMYVSILRKDGVSEREQLEANQTNLLAAIRNLIQENDQLQSQNENFRGQLTNLTVVIGNLTQTSALLERTLTNLTAEKQQLSSNNQELQEKIAELEKFNVTTWSIINDFCPIPDSGGERKCSICPSGWIRTQSSCYVVNNAQPGGRKSWEDAEKNCREKDSHLAVIDDEAEKSFICDHSWGGLGFWIGLKIENRGWKWLDGRTLSQTSWIEAPRDGHCGASFLGGYLRALNCRDRNQWICEKKALSAADLLEKLIG